MRYFVGCPSRCSAVRRTPPPIAWALALAHPLCAYPNLTSPLPCRTRKRQGHPCSEWRARRGDKDDPANGNQISSGTSLMALKDIGCIGFTSSKHPLELEPALCLLLMLTSRFHTSAVQDMARISRMFEFGGCRSLVGSCFMTSSSACKQLHDCRSLRK